MPTWPSREVLYADDDGTGLPMPIVISFTLTRGRRANHRHLKTAGVPLIGRYPRMAKFKTKRVPGGR